LHFFLNFLGNIIPFVVYHFQVWYDLYFLLHIGCFYDGLHLGKQKTMKWPCLFRWNFLALFRYDMTDNVSLFSVAYCIFSDRNYLFAYIPLFDNFFLDHLLVV
jgi:hypothetical protein